MTVPRINKNNETSCQATDLAQELINPNINTNEENTSMKNLDSKLNHQ